MDKGEPQIAIIILTWNNFVDTMECIRSILKSSDFPKKHIYVTDNGSDKFYLTSIQKELEKLNIQYNSFSFDGNRYNREHKINTENSQISILENNENYGFAKGNNIAIQFTLDQNKYEWILILNNDTVVESDSVFSLFDFANKNSEIKIWTPIITYYDKPHLIWNAGGFLSWWGDRKYFGSRQDINNFKTNGFEVVTFITGCSLFIHTSVLRNYGLLTEKFFFGEEDYEFSLRMKKLQIKMAVCLNSVIKHKVSISIKSIAGGNSISMFYIHYLNRVINLRNQYSKLYFFFWKPSFLLVAMFLIWWKRWISPRVLFKFFYLVWQGSKNKMSVTKADFFSARALFNE